MDVPELASLDLEVFSGGRVEQFGRVSRLSIVKLLDLRTTLGPQAGVAMEEFSFQASVFPLAGVTELLEVVKQHSDLREVKRVARLVEDIENCFLRGTLEADSVQRDLDGEFDVTPYLIFFKENAAEVLFTHPKPQKSIKSPEVQISRKVIKALIRLLQAVEQLPSLYRETKLIDLVTEIEQRSYLYQSQKAIIEQTISGKTVAQFLLANLPLIPEALQAKGYELLYCETAAKASRKRVKNKRILTLNQIIMLGETYAGIRNVESLLTSFSDFSARANAVLSDLKSVLMELKVPVHLRLSDDEEGRSYITVCTRVGVPALPGTLPAEKGRKKATASLDHARAHSKADFYFSTVSDFVCGFARLELVQSATQSIADDGKVRSSFCSYLDLLADELKRKVRSDSLSDELLEDLLNDVADHMARGMYEDVFPSWASREDVALHTKCRELSHLLPIDFSLPIDLPAAPHCVALLDQLGSAMTPREKLRLLVEFTAGAVVELNVDYDFASGEHTEEALRYLAFVLIRYEGSKDKAPSLSSHLNYIYKFGTHRQPSIREAVSFSLVKSAVNYILKLHTETSAESQAHGSFSAYL